MTDPTQGGRQTPAPGRHQAGRVRRPAVHLLAVRPWRLLAPVAFAATGTLLVTSAISSQGTDLRSDYADLGTLVEDQRQEVDSLEQEVARLTAEIDTLSAQADDRVAEEAVTRAEALRDPAGLEPVTGRGMTITLDDAPEDVIEQAVESGEFEADDLVVHQQDIQAVANALWKGGAVAMTIQGQRVISTTGIKCVGNTVVLHDVPYSPPYVLTAVGDPQALMQAVAANDHIRIYRQYAEAVQLGWDVETRSEVTVPGYEGSLDLDYATALDSTATSAAAVS